MNDQQVSPKIWVGDWWTIAFEGGEAMALILNGHRAIGCHRGLEMWVPSRCLTTIVSPQDLKIHHGTVEVPKNGERVEPPTLGQLAVKISRDIDDIKDMLRAATVAKDGGSRA